MCYSIDCKFVTSTEVEMENRVGSFGMSRGEQRGRAMGGICIKAFVKEAIEREAGEGKKRRQCACLVITFKTKKAKKANQRPWLPACLRANDRVRDEDPKGSSKQLGGIGGAQSA